MSDVTLSIAGRRYTLACAAGEEEHIAMLGSEIDARVAGMPNVSRRSESQTLLYAALLLADDLHETRNSAKPHRREGANLDAVAEPLENLAKMLESLADELEDSLQTP